MAKKFKDPIAVTKKESGEMPWSFKAPSYDNRTSCSITAGDDYGVGHTQPIGKEKASNKGPIPQISFCFDPYEFLLSKDKKG